MNDTPRETPKEVEAERAVLGAMMVDDTGEVADAVLGTALRSKDFYLPHHEALFTLLEAMRKDGRPTDLVMVASAIRADATRYGGAAYVAGLPSNVVSTVNVVSHYVPLVLNASRARQMLRAAGELQHAVHSAEDLREIADRFAAVVTNLVPVASTAELPATMAEALAAVEAGDRNGPAPYVPSMIPELDKLLLGGFQAGDLVIVAGRPSWGKSSLALSFLVEQARNGYQAGIISLEMNRAKIVSRVMAQLASVSTEAVKVGGYDPEERDAIARARDLANELPLSMDTRSGLTTTDIRRTCAVWKRNQGLDILVIDYLGLIRHTGKGDNQAKIIGETVKECLRIGKEFEVPVILCCQLNRELVKAAPTKGAPDAEWWTQITMPQLHHLRESGDIEQDADVVIFPIPADVLRAQKIAPNLRAAPGAAVLQIAKNRQGSIGEVAVRWNGPSMRYSADAPVAFHEPDRRPLRAVGGTDYHDRDDEQDDIPY